MSVLSLYNVLICIPFLLLPSLKLTGVIGDKVFIKSYFMFAIILCLEILFYGSYVSVIFIILCVIFHLIHNVLLSVNDKYTYAIILYYNDKNGILKLFDGITIKEIYSGFNMEYFEGEILRLSSDFWKNI